VSALDVSVQAQRSNLIEDIKAAYALTVVFIAHDLSVVRAVSDDVMVMYLGKVCEFGDADWCTTGPPTRTPGPCSIRAADRLRAGVRGTCS